MTSSKEKRMQDKNQIDRKEMYAELLSQIKKNDNFIITTHKSCDPDGMGSELGLDFLLEKLGKKHTILNPDKTPDRYLFLDPLNRIHNYGSTILQSTQRESFVIMVDNSDIPRILDIANYLNEDKSNLISIDHHDKVAPYKGLFCFPEVGSSSEIVFELIELAGFEPDYNTSVSLYMGIVMDTGQFKYNKTRPRTHEIASKLLKHKFPTEELIRKVFEDYSYTVLLLKKDIYSTLDIYPEFKIASVDITRTMLSKYNFTNNPAEGIISELLAPADIHIAVSFTEIENGTTKISLRSKGKYDVCSVAREYSGGGHTNASGATIKGEYKKIKLDVLEKLMELSKITH
jgi:phosphoesterase RecJ-like protein